MRTLIFQGNPFPGIIGMERKVPFVTLRGPQHFQLRGKHFDSPPNIFFSLIKIHFAYLRFSFFPVKILRVSNISGVRVSDPQLPPRTGSQPVGHHNMSYHSISYHTISGHAHYYCISI